MANAPTKPMIFADDPLEGMDETLDLRAGNWDTSYVRGYSELKKENQLRERDGKAPLPLPRLQWVRISKGDSDVSETDEGMLSWRRLRYRACGTDQLKELAEEYWPDYGYEFPPTAHVASDGTIRRGDLALFFIPPRLAEMNRMDEAAAKKEHDERVKGLDAPDGVEVIENKRTEERQTSPRAVFDAGIPRP